MKQLLKLRMLATGMALSALLVVATTGSAFAAPAKDEGHGQQPPSTGATSGQEAKPAIEPGSRDATLSERLGNTELVKTNSDGKASSSGVSTMAGVVSNVDFLAPINYCWKNLVYTPVKNTTAATKYLNIRIYNQGSYRDIYTSVAANSTVYPASYGISGSYTAYLYVWNGTSYQYDEYRTGANNCNISVTRTYNSGGWVQLKIQNLGTAYASQQSTELAPFPASGTYTGTHFDAPAPGGAAIYRWFWVGTSPYGIVSSTSGSFNTPYLFSGDL